MNRKWWEWWNSVCLLTTVTGWIWLRRHSIQSAIFNQHKTGKCGFLSENICSRTTSLSAVLTRALFAILPLHWMLCVLSFSVRLRLSEDHTGFVLGGRSWRAVNKTPISTFKPATDNLYFFCVMVSSWSRCLTAQYNSCRIFTPPAFTSAPVNEFVCHWAWNLPSWQPGNISLLLCLHYMNI